jgi:hypothetical protein
MKPTSATLLAALLTALAGPAALAADAPAAPAAVPAPQPAEADTPSLGERVRSEPAVKRTVIDDDLVHIEELRVRGQLQKVTVESKGRAPDYEILVGDGSRDLSTGANTSRGAAGKRVWNLFRF